MKLFYEDKIEQAIELSVEQLKDGWTLEGIREYWFALGYDIFFVNKVIKSLKEIYAQ